MQILFLCKPPSVCIPLMSISSCPRLHYFFIDIAKVQIIFVASKF